MDTPITSFSGPNRFLSNFYPAPVEIPHGESILKCPTVEHGYQAMKPLRWDHAAEIAEAPDPGIAKHLGRRYPCRPDWDAVKLEIMFELLLQKFTNFELAAMLKNTGKRELVEGNTWGDQFWGRVLRGKQWVGANWLGQHLMRIRDEILR